MRGLCYECLYEIFGVSYTTSSTLPRFVLKTCYNTCIFLMQVINVIYYDFVILEKDNFTLYRIDNLILTVSAQLYLNMGWMSWLILKYRSEDIRQLHYKLNTLCTNEYLSEVNFNVINLKAFVILIMYSSTYVFIRTSFMIWLNGSFEFHILLFTIFDLWAVMSTSQFLRAIFVLQIIFKEAIKGFDRWIRRITIDEFERTTTKSMEDNADARKLFHLFRVIVGMKKRTVELYGFSVLTFLVYFMSGVGCRVYDMIYIRPDMLFSWDQVLFVFQSGSVFVFFGIAEKASLISCFI